MWQLKERKQIEIEGSQMDPKIPVGSIIFLITNFFIWRTKFNYNQLKTFRLQNEHKKMTADKYSLKWGDHRQTKSLSWLDGNRFEHDLGIVNCIGILEYNDILQTIYVSKGVKFISYFACHALIFWSSWFQNHFPKHISVVHNLSH